MFGIKGRSQSVNKAPLNGDSVLMPGVVIEDGAVVTRVLVADGVTIGKNSVVGAADSENIELIAKDIEGGQ